MWVTLHELPLRCYNKVVISALLAPMGKIFLDATFIQKTRGSVAKVRIQTNVTKDRPSHIWMGIDKSDFIIWRWLNGIPDYCNKQSHLVEVLSRKEIIQIKKMEVEAEK